MCGKDQLRERVGMRPLQYGLQMFLYVTAEQYVRIFSMQKEGGTMSATARSYAYQVIIERGKGKPVPTISLETLKQYQDDMKKYLAQENKHKNDSPHTI